MLQLIDIFGVVWLLWSYTKNM